jgi:hypothetical protein
MTQQPVCSPTLAANWEPAATDILTLQVRNTLGEFALLADLHVKIAGLLVVTAGSLRPVFEQHPELRGPPRELLHKLNRLTRLERDLSAAVMQYSPAWSGAPPPPHGPPGVPPA